MELSNNIFFGNLDNVVERLWSYTSQDQDDYFSLDEDGPWSTPVDNDVDRASQHESSSAHDEL